MLATEYAEYYGLQAQQQDESDPGFRGRVATALREQGHIIEAYEAYHDERYETSDNVMTGILGATAQAMEGTNYGGNPVGNDIAAGLYVSEQMSPEYEQRRQEDLMMALLMIGMR